MPNMQAIAPIMTSCAKKRVHAHWKMHAPIHQGVIVVTIGLARYDGNICATANTPSQMKMGPQIEKAKPQQKQSREPVDYAFCKKRPGPDGVRRVWYLALRLLLVGPKAPVKEP